MSRPRSWKGLCPNGEIVLVGQLLLSVSSLVDVGCVDPNTYGPARTTPRGQISHTLAAGVSGHFLPKATRTQTRTDPIGQPAETVSVVQSADSRTWPAPPMYMIRWGAAENLEVAFRASLSSSLGVDLKYNFFRTKAFDAALVPGAHGALSVAALHLPVLMDFNLGQVGSIVWSPGISYIWQGETDDSSTSRASLGSWSGVFGRCGLGMNLRATKRFALHPEVTALRGIRSADPTLWHFGLGFNFGALPVF